MDFKKIRKGIARLSGWLGLISCSLIIKIMPSRWLYSFACGLARLAYFFARRQREIALESLEIAFGRQKSQAEREIIARECFIFMAKSATELMFLMDRPRLLRERVVMEGVENLEAALARGKGAILVSAHFGNFPLMMAKLALSGYKIAGIMRAMRDVQVEKFFLKKRNRLGVKTIYSYPRRVCVADSIKSLRDNELLFIPIDQNFGEGGIFVDFFGRKAATATGPIVLARRTGAVLLPCFIVRQKDDTNKIIFEPPMDLKEGASEGESTIINIQRLTDIIESYIRKYPSQWGWIHRRWKSRPTNNVKGGG